MIKNILFDFDGVICESVHIKTEAFYEMYLPYGEEIAQKVKEHHLANGGMSRFDKFRYYEETFLKKHLTKTREDELSAHFSQLVKEKVIGAPFVNGALEFLKEHAQHYRCFIVSATPMDEMIEIAKAKKIDHYFKKICGSPKNKIEWGAYILQTWQLKPEETLFIGDALSDYRAAQAHQMHFLLRRTVDNRTLFSESIESMEDLTHLPLFLSENT